MNVLSLGRSVLVAFLVVPGCAGGDNFKPAPGAAVTPDELDALIEAVVQERNLEVVSNFVLEPQVEGPNRLGCTDAGVEPCIVTSGPAGLPGRAIRLRDEEGNDISLSLQLAGDSQEAGEMVRGQTAALGLITTLNQRQMSAPEMTGSIGAGPCDHDVNHDDDMGCAWQERGAPGVGDTAEALRSDVVEGARFAFVAFAREDVIAMVSVRRHDAEKPDQLADDIAKAVDKQIKQALSQ